MVRARAIVRTRTCENHKEPVVQSKKSAGDKPIQRVIKKYPNRRLYDTETSAYITIQYFLAHYWPNHLGTRSNVSRIA